MDAKTVDEFAVRFYKWSLDDTQRELGEGFPLLRRVKGASALGLIDYIESLPAEQRGQFVVALVKRVHLKALEITGDHLTGDENELINQYLSSHMNFVGKYFNEYGVQRYKPGIRGKSLDKKKLAALITDKLRPVCGEVHSRYQKYEWLHRTTCEGWFIDTLVEVLNWNPQIKYYHYIVSPVEEAEYIKREALDWSGIYLRLGVTPKLLMGFFPVEWDMLLPGDEEQTAEVLAELCSHFMNAAPTLLAGLQP